MDSGIVHNQLGVFYLNNNKYNHKILEVVILRLFIRKYEKAVFR